IAVRRPRRPSLFPYTTLFRSGRFALLRLTVREVLLDEVLHGARHVGGAVVERHDLAAPDGREDGLAEVPGEDREHVRAVRLGDRSEEHTSELQSQSNLVCRLL